MLNIFANTIPIYLIIGIGFIAVRCDLFTTSELRAPGTFVVTFAMPALLFTALSLRPVSNILLLWIMSTLS